MHDDVCMIVTLAYARLMPAYARLMLSLLTRSMNSRKRICKPYSCSCSVSYTYAGLRLVHVNAELVPSPFILGILMLGTCLRLLAFASRSAQPGSCIRFRSVSVPPFAFAFASHLHLYIHTYIYTRIVHLPKGIKALGLGGFKR